MSCLKRFRGSLCGSYERFCQFGGQMFSARMAFSPFNVVAWHGNYVPYKYNLDKFCTMNAVNYDHPVRLWIRFRFYRTRYAQFCRVSC